MRTLAFLFLLTPTLAFLLASEEQQEGVVALESELFVEEISKEAEDVMQVTRKSAPAEKKAPPKAHTGAHKDLRRGGDRPRVIQRDGKKSSQIVGRSKERVQAEEKSTAEE